MCPSALLKPQGSKPDEPSIAINPTPVEEGNKLKFEETHATMPRQAAETLTLSYGVPATQVYEAGVVKAVEAADSNESANEDAGTDDGLDNLPFLAQGDMPQALEEAYSSAAPEIAKLVSVCVLCVYAMLK